MLERISRLLVFIQNIITAILGVTSLYFIDILGRSLGNIFAIIVLIIIVILLSTLLREFLIILIERSLWLRKVISGKHFIEGVWIDKTFDIYDNQRIISSSIFSLFYEDGELRYRGEIFDSEGNSVGSFWSSSTHYSESEHSIRSSFTGKILYPQHDEVNLFGFAEYTFTPTDTNAISFHGYALDNLEGKKRVIQSVKLLDHKRVKNINNPQIRKEIIQEFILNK